MVTTARYMGLRTNLNMPPMTSRSVGATGAGVPGALTEGLKIKAGDHTVGELARSDP